MDKKELKIEVNKNKESGLNYISVATILWLAPQYALNHELIVENGKIYEVIKK